MPANLIKNPGAEAGTGGTGDPVTVPKWAASGTATAVKYGTPNFPTVNGPGPPRRGKNLFAGGNYDGNDVHVLSQHISLSPYVAKIKGGHVTFTLSGFFGGFTSQDDLAGLEVGWLDANGVQLPVSAQIGFVTAAERNDVTGLLRRSATYAVASAARSAVVSVVFQRSAGGYNDGYADNVSLVLKGV